MISTVINISLYLYVYIYIYIYLMCIYIYNILIYFSHFSSPPHFHHHFHPFSRHAQGQVAMSPCDALARAERLPQHPGLCLAGGARGARGEAEGGVGADGVEAHDAGSVDSLYPQIAMIINMNIIV